MCGTVAPQLAGNQLRKASSEIILHFLSFDDFDSWLFSVGCLLSILYSILHQIQILDVRNILIIWAADRKANEHEKFSGIAFYAFAGEGKITTILRKINKFNSSRVNFKQPPYPPPQTLLPHHPPPFALTNEEKIKLVRSSCHHEHFRRILVEMPGRFSWGRFSLREGGFSKIFLTNATVPQPRLKFDPIYK